MTLISPDRIDADALLEKPDDPAGAALAERSGGVVAKPAPVKSPRYGNRARGHCRAWRAAR